MPKIDIVFRLAELFCGPGGLALGAKSAFVANENYTAKIIPVWANDINPDACKTYIRNIHPDNPDAVVCKPVQDVDLENIPNFDAFAYGFPCNDFSVVGEQKGINGTYGPLYAYGVKLLSIYQPKWFMAENVSGIQNSNDGTTFQKILRELESAGNGYHLTAHLYKFEDYGVPQYRHRIVIVGIRRDLNLQFRVPAPFTCSRYLSSRDAIMIPPIRKDAYNNELTKQSNLVVERLKYIPPGENAWYEGIPKHLRLNVHGAKLSQIYRRLDPNKPAYTITGSGGGGTHGYHWSENRALTNRERARLQTFPDDFIFEGSKESVRQQIGMAVPPKSAKIIFESVLKTFLNIPYPAIKPSIINGADKRKQLKLINGV
jgi:DNA (cytosine-5)-methyltransferase 1